jgi:CTP:phosphocholine cytidylyltransferase-like protein
MYGMHTSEEIEYFENMYISCDVSLHYQSHYKIHNNINTHVHVKKKMLFVNFFTHCLLCMK